MAIDIRILLVLAAQRRAAANAAATAAATTAGEAATTREGDTILTKKPGVGQTSLFEKLGETTGRKKLG